MKLTIDQVAFYPRDPAAARKLLEDMGATEWNEDHVKAQGKVYGDLHVANEADLAFNYQLGAPKEFEILKYTSGNNWLNVYSPGRISHLGMHVSAKELEKWREFFYARDISVAQEVFTVDHTNPALVADGRHYHYVIFETRPILGVDLKFIVRT